MIVLGLVLGLVGTDVNSGMARYSFNVPELIDGLEFRRAWRWACSVSAEVIKNLSRTLRKTAQVFTKATCTGLMPSQAGLEGHAAPAVLRGTALGSAPGHLCPAAARWLGGVLRPIRMEKEDQAAHPAKRLLAKARSKAWRRRNRPTTPAAQTSFIPLLTLGIPPNAVMALMVGAMTIHNIQPGPQVMTSNPSCFGA